MLAGLLGETESPTHRAEQLPPVEGVRVEPGPGRLVGLDVLQPVDDPATDLQISRPLLEPAPALESPMADPPATAELDLVQVMRQASHFGLRLRSRSACFSSFSALTL